ncbi:MAG: hypothetical protein ABII96_07880 [Candidatus Zixiibacteriota bacterium]
MAKAVMATISDLSNDIRNTRRQTAEEIEHWLSMHLLARPGRPIATMKFTDWVKFRKVLRTKYGAFNLKEEKEASPNGEPLSSPQQAEGYPAEQQ